MLYAAPPEGSRYDDAAIFLASVRQMAVKIVETIGRFNTDHAGAAGGTIPVLRMCGFSSGIYRHPATSVTEVVAAIYEGLADSVTASTAHSGLARIEFPSGAGFEAFAADAEGPRQ